VAQSNVNSAVKNKQQKLRTDIGQNKGQMRKFSHSGVAEDQEDEFRNKTLRFTNNNFVGTRGKESSVEGWVDQNKKLNDSNDNGSDNLYESIEEEIACSQNESPLIDAKRKANAAGLMPPLAPKQQS
jgi:hypothetical protein